MTKNGVVVLPPSKLRPVRITKALEALPTADEQGLTIAGCFDIVATNAKARI